MYIVDATYTMIVNLQNAEIGDILAGAQPAAQE